MRLRELEIYNPIVIQCHDNPDPDAVGAGYALYRYFLSRDKDVRLVYSGQNRIQKANLKLLTEELAIPIEYLSPGEKIPPGGLLVTVDCQYGAGNVTQFEAAHTAVIDHHQPEIPFEGLVRIQPGLGSCCTLAWIMLREEGFTVEDPALGTALYYGLYADTGQFSEICNPLDLDLRDSVPFDKGLMNRLRNCNLSLNELEIAGIALIRCSYDKEHHFAVIKAEPCDPNILGLISDFLLQVDEINCCVVYNENEEHFKLSVRSCVPEVNASELAAFLTEGMGSGGGRGEKAGGMISKKLYAEKYQGIYSESYINGRMVEYFESFSIIFAWDSPVDVSGMKLYRLRRKPVGYVDASSAFRPGTRITVRTRAGDLDMKVEKDLIWMLGTWGELTLCGREVFERYFDRSDMPFTMEDCCGRAEYVPVIKNQDSGSTFILGNYAGVCFPNSHMCVYARRLGKGIKIFTRRDGERYMTGRPGDYLAVCADNTAGIFVMDRDAFPERFDEVPLF